MPRTEIREYNSNKQVSNDISTQQLKHYSTAILQIYNYWSLSYI